MEKQSAGCLKKFYNDLNIKKSNNGDQNSVPNNFPNSNQPEPRKLMFTKQDPCWKALLAETNLPVGTSPGAAAVPIFAGMCSLLEKNTHSLH